MQVRSDRVVDQVVYHMPVTPVQAHRGASLRGCLRTLANVVANDVRSVCALASKVASFVAVGLLRFLTRRALWHPRRCAMMATLLIVLSCP